VRLLINNQALVKVKARVHNLLFREVGDIGVVSVIRDAVEVAVVAITLAAHVGI
jgi:hypothetical protein